MACLLPYLLIAVVFLQAAKTPVVIAGALRSADLTIADPSCDDDLSSEVVQLSEVAEETDDADCTDCASRKENMTEDEANQLRIEMAKQQILEKLHMTKPPCRSLPKPPLQPLLEAAEMLDNTTEEDDEGEDNDMGSTVKSMALYPTTGSTSCTSGSDQPCSHFEFQFRRDTISTNPVSADLWLYKHDVQDVLKITQLVYNVLGRRGVRRRDIVPQNEQQHSARLVKFKLPPSTTWDERGEYMVLSVEVFCQSGCNPGPAVSEKKEELPFLIVNFNANKSSSRNRRSIDCVEGNNFCCRKSLTLSFQEVGWDDWIIAPSGYEVNFCWGKCHTSDPNTKFHHTTVMHSYIERNFTAVQKLGLKLCCTPSKMSSLSILYQDGSGNIVKRELPDMKVEACKCA